MAVCAGAILLGIFGHPLRDPNRLRHGMALAQIEAFLTALERYRGDCKQYPANLDGLDALSANPGVTGWRGPYIAQDVPLDPWGRHYRYEYSPEKAAPEIKSYGADGKPGGLFFDADISSRNLQVAVARSPAEAKARRFLIACTAVACAGLLASFLLWGFAARREGDDAEEGM